jgi:glycolate oxidase iron-sulfur subunit
MSHAPAAAGHRDVPDATLIDACVHCGFCLPACPTYVLDQEEMDSPRGRIYLMRAVRDGRAAIDADYVTHFDRCLGCLACVTACPSGVQYGSLVEGARAQIERERPRTGGDRWFRAAIFAVFPYPARLRIALLPLLVYQRLEAFVDRLRLDRLFPDRLRAMIGLAPRVTLSRLFAPATPERTPASTARRATVGLLTGCAQRVMFPHVNEATRRVLAADGCDVIAPSRQRCCGALSLHAGRVEEARAAARQTIGCFEAAGVDRVVVNAAGCGSAMKEYGHLLAGDPAWASRAGTFSSRVRDVSEFLAELGPPQAPRHPLPLRVVYQDACHLSHAQGIRRQPREILSVIPGLTLVEPPDADLCCGSAGIYNLLEPDAARRLGDRKLAALTSVAAQVIVSANPGCSLQIAAAARRAGRAVVVRHPIELVAASTGALPGDLLDRG